MQEAELEDEREGYEEVHVYAERGAEVAVHREGEGSEEGNTAAGTKVKLDTVCIKCSCLCTCVHDTQAMAKRSIILRTGPKKPTFKVRVSTSGSILFVFKCLSSDTEPSA